MFLVLCYAMLVDLNNINFAKSNQILGKNVEPFEYVLSDNVVLSCQVRFHKKIYRERKKMFVEKKARSQNEKTLFEKFFWLW